MTLEFSSEESENLAKALFIASWISEASENPDKDSLFQLEQTVYAALFAAGRRDLLEYDETLDQYFVLADHEEEWVEEFIAPHDDEHLWESLQTELAKRDLVLDPGIKELERMNETERSLKMQEARDRYNQEFALHGLKNIFVRKAFDA